MAPCPASPSAGWGRAKAKADAPSRSAPHLPAYGPVLARLRPRPCPPTAESLCAKAEVHKAIPASARAFSPRQSAYGRAPAACVPNHCAQRRKCTRQTPPLPVRSPRGNLSTAASPPACVPNHCAQRRKCTRQSPPLPVRSPRGNLSTAVPPPACVSNHCVQRRKCTRQTPPLPVRSPRGSLSTAALPPADGRSAERRVGEGEGKGGRPLAQQPALSPPTAPLLPPKWAPRLRRREGKRPNGAPPHRNAHTPNAERKRYLHNSRTMTQRRTKRCAQFVIFVFTPCKLLHNFSTVLHRSPRNVPKRAQIAARRPDFPCFTARFSHLSPESHCAKHPRTAPVLPPKNAPLRAYAKPRSHSRVRGTRQHATTCAFFTFSARYERIGGARIANFCPAEGRKRGRLRSQMLKNGLQTKKSTFSFGRLVI